MTALALVVSGPLAHRRGRGARALGDAAVTAWQLGKWPVMLASSSDPARPLLRVAERARERKWVSAGRSSRSSSGSSRRSRFAFYVANFGSYNKMYGTMGGVVVFLLWLWITNIAVLLGVEFNAERSARARCTRRARREEELKLPERDALARSSAPGPPDTLGRIPALAELTTLRLGGPAGRFVDAADEGAIVAAVRAADAAGEPLLVLAGGSNLVVADAGFPGTVLRIASRGVRERRRAVRGRRGRAVGPVRRALGGGRPRRRRVPLGHPGLGRRDADPERRRLRPGGRPRRSSPCARTTARSDGARDPGGRVRLLLPLERVQAHARPLGRPRGHVRAASAGRDSQPIRYAELARALGIAEGERAPLADVREAVLALRRGKGMVSTPPTPTRSRPARSSRTRARRRRVRRAGGARPRVARRRRARAALPAARRARQDVGRVADRARRLHAGHGDPATVAISGKHTLALTNRGAGTTAQLVALAREIAAGVRDRSASSSCPSRCSSDTSGAPAAQPSR